MIIFSWLTLIPRLSCLALDARLLSAIKGVYVMSRHCPPGTQATKRHLSPQMTLVQASERAQRLGQYPGTIWLTGYSGSGKSTLAFGLEQRLIAAGYAAAVLDGDTVRSGLCSDLGFSLSERAENIRRVAEVAKLMNDAGLIVIVALISPLAREREHARQIIGADRFVEVFVDTPLAICQQRDPKGLYKRALAGEIPDFTGVSSPYEAPIAPDLRILSSVCAPEQAVEVLFRETCNRFNHRRTTPS